MRRHLIRRSWWFAVAVALTVSTFGAAKATDDWSQTGVGGGGWMTDIEFHPTNEDVIYIGSDIAGVFRTTDGGTHWDASARGLNNHYVQEILVLPNDPDPDVLLVGLKEGLARSTDAGATFSMIHDEDLSTTGADPNVTQGLPIEALAVDLGNDDIVYAGAGSFREWDKDVPDQTREAMYRSTDGGATWSAMNLPNGIDATGVHSIVPIGDEDLMVSTTSGVFHVFRLPWTGAWTAVPSNGAGPDDVLPHTDCRGLAATFDANDDLDRLFVVLNTHWDEKDPNSVYENDDNYGGGVWYTDDYGVTWFPASPEGDCFELHFSGPSQPKNMRHVVVEPDLGIIYVGLNWRAGSTEGVWAGIPIGGDYKWRRMTESRPVDENNMEDTWRDVLTGGNGLAISPGGDLIFTNSIAAWRCEDGGCFPEKQPDGHGGCLDLYNEGVDHWEALHTEEVGSGAVPKFAADGLDVTNVWDIVVVDNGFTETWFACQADVGLLRSDNGGQSWLAPFDYRNGGSGPEYECADLAGIGNSSNQFMGVFGESGGGVMQFDLWVTNGLPHASSSWTQIDVNGPAPGTVNVREVKVYSTTEVFVLADDGIYILEWDATNGWEFDSKWVTGLDGSYKVSDLVWISQGFGPTRFIVSTLKDATGTGGIATADGVGSDWDPYDFSWPWGSSITCLELNATDDDIVYAGGASSRTSDGGGVLKSTDQGDSWAPISVGASGYPESAIGGYSSTDFDVVGLAHVANSGLYAALSHRKYQYEDEHWEETVFGGVYLSTNDATWSPFLTGLDAGDMNYLKVDETNPNRLFAGTEGNGHYWSTVSTSFREVNLSPEVPAASSRPALTLSTANPTRGASTLQLRLATRDKVSLEIVDVSGRRIRSLHDGLLEGGTHVIDWDGRSDLGAAVPSGVYFVRALTSNEDLRERIVVMR